jgi:hypothetical protein
MLLNNDIQFNFCSNDFIFSKGNKCNYYIIEIFLKSKLKSTHLNKISIRYDFSMFIFL